MGSTVARGRQEERERHGGSERGREREGEGGVAENDIRHVTVSRM